MQISFKYATCRRAGRPFYSASTAPGVQAAHLPSAKEQECLVSERHLHQLRCRQHGSKCHHCSALDVIVERRHRDVCRNVNKDDASSGVTAVRGSTGPGSQGPCCELQAGG